MVNCRVESYLSGYLVTFEDGKSLLLQSDFDYISFAVNCGLIPVPESWNGSPNGLEVDPSDYDLSDITECPEEYYDAAEFNK